MKIVIGPIVLALALATSAHAYPIAGDPDGTFRGEQIEAAHQAFLNEYHTIADESWAQGGANLLVQWLEETGELTDGQELYYGGDYQTLLPAEYAGDQDDVPVDPPADPIPEPSLLAVFLACVLGAFALRLHRR